MMASVKAHEHMDENLSNVDAGVEDLVGGGKIEAEKTFDFGPTLTTKGDLKWYVSTVGLKRIRLGCRRVSLGQSPNSKR